MAKTKAELEDNHDRHRELMSEARSELRQGEFHKAVQTAMLAWDHVDGMMQYDRRWGGKSEFEDIDSIALVLRYSPLLFDDDSFDQLAALLKSQRRIDKNTAVDISADLEAAMSTMWDAYQLWTKLESEGELRQDELCRTFGGDQDRWRWIAETWERMGILQRVQVGGSYRLSLVTRLDAPTRGKCPECGVTGQAAKIQLLQEVRCPKCQHTVFFVLLPSANKA